MWGVFQPTIFIAIQKNLPRLHNLDLERYCSHTGRAAAYGLVAIHQHLAHPPLPGFFNHRKTTSQTTAQVSRLSYFKKRYTKSRHCKSSQLISTHGAPAHTNTSSNDSSKSQLT